MGIVRGIQKGEADPSDFNKDAQDAAKKMKKSSVKKYAKTKHKGLPLKKESMTAAQSKAAHKKFKETGELPPHLKKLFKDLDKVKTKHKVTNVVVPGLEWMSKLGEAADRDYKAEYKKFQSSTKSKKYRAELNKYNRKKGTYGNGDGKDASHRGGKIVGFEKESVNRGRAEKSRLKKEANMPDFNPMIDKALDEVIEEYTMSRKGVIDKIATLAKANRYGTVDGTQMNGKSAKEIIAIYNHPKMKKFKKAMADYTVDDFVNLSIKLKKVLGIKVEAKVNINKKEMDKLHKGDKIEKDGTEIIFKEEDLMNENPAAIAAAQRMVVQNKMGKKVSVMTAKNASYKEKDPSAHNKAKSIFQRIKDRFKKKNESVNEAGMELKKLEDAIKFFKKKIEKQGRVTNARDEDHLERLMKVYNDMGGRKIKENDELFEWLQEACWKGYEKKGMKTMFGKRYPNCVKKTKKEGLGDRISKISKKYAKGQKKSKKALKNKKGPYQEGVNEVSDKQKRKIYKKAFGKEYDDPKRKQAPLPLDIAYKVALNRLKKKEGVNENSAEKAKIVKFLIKYGNNPKEVKPWVDKHYKKAKGDRSGATPAQLAQYISFLTANESVNEDVWTPAETKAVDKIDGEFQKMMAKKGIEPYSVEASRLWRSAGYNKKMRKIFGKNESVNEARLDPKQLLQQLGGNKFIMMTGAKNLAVDKAKNTLHMKIGRNAKGISHLRIKLTGADLYDMEFLQIRAGNIKVKAKVKGIYADQLQKMFTKHTGMYTSLGTMGR